MITNPYNHGKQPPEAVYTNLRWSLLLNKFAGNFIKKRPQHRCFPKNFMKF